MVASASDVVPRKGKRWTERDVQLIRGSTAKAWTALGDRLYLRTHVGTDGTTHKTFYHRGGQGSPFRSLGKWPDMSLSAARGAVAAVKLGVRNVQSTATFAAAADEFLAHLPQTMRRPDDLRELYALHLRDILGPKKLRDLTAADVSAMVNKLVRKGKRETAIKAASLTRRILDRAVVHGSVAYNVATPFRATYLGGRNPPRERVLTDDEIDRFLESSHDHPRGRVARFLLATGCRVGEATQAQRQWIKDGVLTLPATITKQAREHRVGLSTYALNQIEGSGDWLFPSPFHSGRHAQSRAAAWLTVTTIAKNAGIEGLTTHDLRRTARTKWSELRIDPLTAEFMLGHSKPGLLAVYDHSRLDADAAKGWQLWGEWLAARDSTKLPLVA